MSNGKPVFQNEEWKKYTGSYIDNNFLIEFLKPEEYFEFIGFLYGIHDIKKRIEEFNLFMNSELIGLNKLIRNLSDGNKQKVGIMGAMLSKPNVLILDEPFNYLDPSSQIILKQILLKFNRERGCTIILSSHNLTHVSEICTRVALMEKGKIIGEFSNSPSDIEKIENYFKNQVSSNN